MSKKADTTIDDVLKELRGILREKKRDKVLAKIDSLFFVLVTLATFFSGIAITWHQTLIQSRMMTPIIGLLATLVCAFMIGFKGMVNDDVDTRIYSWSILFASSFWAVGWLAIGISENIYIVLQIQATAQGYLGNLIVGIVTGISQSVFLKHFISWAENKLTSLLNESVETSPNVYKRALRTVTIIWIISMILGISLSVFLLLEF